MSQDGPVTGFTFEQLKAADHDHARLFLVDGHLNDPPDRQHRFTPTFLGQETIIMTEQNAELRKRFKHCYYRVEGFSDIRVVWPMKWPAPGPNKLGWLPKLEFGNPENGPYYNEINPALAGKPVAPFAYMGHDGTEVIGVGNA